MKPPPLLSDSVWVFCAGFQKTEETRKWGGEEEEVSCKICMRKFVKMPDLYWSSISDCLSGVRELTAWLRTANICISRSSPHLLTALNSPRAPSAPAAFSACSAIPAGWILKYWSFSSSSGNFDIQCRHFRWPLPFCPDHYSYRSENWIHLKGYGVFYEKCNIY